MMNPYHSEFNCYWELKYIPENDFKDITLKMIDDAIVDDCDYDNANFFQSDFKMFCHARIEIIENRNIELWTPIFLDFIKRYPHYKKDEVTKAIEILQATKSKHLLKELNMSDDLDIKVYMQIIEYRNNILNKYNLNPISNF